MAEDSLFFYARLILGGLGLVIIGFGIGWLAGLSASPIVSIILTSITGAAGAIIAATNGLKDKRNQLDIGDNEQTPIQYWQYITPWPLAMLIIGIVLGSILGIRARNNSWMGSDISSEIRKWTTAGLGQEEVVRRLFELEYPHNLYVPLTSQNEVKLSSDITSTLGLASEIKMWTDFGLSEEEVARRLFESKFPSNGNTTNSVRRNDNVGGSILYAAGAQECDMLYSTLKLVQGPLSEQEIANLRSRVETTKFQGLWDLIEEPETLRAVLEELCTPGLFFP